MRSPLIRGLLAPVVDWQKLALDLRTAGVPHVQASRAIGEHPGYVAQLARGEVREPKFSQAVALLNLHCDRCGAERTEALGK